MKKLALITLLVFSTSMFAKDKAVKAKETTTPATTQTATTVTTPAPASAPAPVAVSTTSSDRDSYFELRVGPKFNVRNFSNQISTGMAVGGKYSKFLFDYSYGGGNYFRIALLVDIPITIDFSNGMALAFIPTFDLGPAFIMSGAVKMISFLPFGYGLKTAFYFNDRIGVAFTPVHFTMSFASLGFAGGNTAFSSTMQASYDLIFSFILKW